MSPHKRRPDHPRAPRPCFLLSPPDSHMITTAEQARQFIQTQVDSFLSHRGQPELAQLALKPLADSRFCTWPAAGMGSDPSTKKTRRGHHCFPGGLLIHVAQVLDLSLAAAKPLAPPDARIFQFIILGVMYHDWAKTLDYEPSFSADGKLITGVKKTWHATHIHHIHTGASWFERDAEELGIHDPELLNNVCHILLSHHGRPEWGSAVQPATPAARIVHAADDLSAKHYGIYEDFFPKQ